jgi:cell division septation protein DedD
MISTVRYFLLALLTTGLVTACGGSDQQQTQQQSQQQQQARQDSIAQAKADSIARAKADSMAKAQKQKEQEKMKKEKEAKEKDQLTISDISFNSSGAFSVQVGAWRSEEKAEQLVSTWKKRGFSNAYVVMYGNKDTGNIWFRVRLGQVSNRSMAQKVQKLVKMKYNENSWISEAKSGA